MGELESRTGLNNVSRHSDGGGGRLGARRATAQRSARRLEDGSGLDDCDEMVGVEGWLSAGREEVLRLAVRGELQKRLA